MMVTGAGSGIGRGVALEAAARGATVYIVGRRIERLKETIALAEGAPGTLIPLACDLTDPVAVDALFTGVETEGGPVQALAHCAASVQYQPAREITFESFSQVIGTTLFTAFNTLHRWARPLLDTEFDGVAVALTSSVAHRGTPGVAHSSAGKSGIEGYVKSVAREWGGSGIRMNVVGPGRFPVEKSKDMWDRLTAEENSTGTARIAVGRYGRLSEIVGPIMFMLSEAAGFLTGEVLHVGGGDRLTPAIGAPPGITAAQATGDA
ncbi:SDR family NAD(P)-dependent oxidoreductase [Pseudonocardia halophobica]|nr:SDR family oxidoreductase [Pseudonocardia halophobica]